MSYTREQLEAMPANQLARLVNQLAGCEYEVCDIHTGARRPALDADLDRTYGVGITSGTPLFQRDVLDGDGMLRLMDWLRTAACVTIDTFNTSPAYDISVHQKEQAGYQFEASSTSLSAPRALAVATLLSFEACK